MKNYKTKIFVDCHIFDKNYQGTTTYIKGIYSEFIKDKSKEFYLAAVGIDNLKKVFGTHDNVQYLQLKTKNKLYRLLFDIPKLIKRNKIDFAHFQYIVPPIKYCNYIVTIHDVLFLQYPEYFPFSYRFQNKLLFKWSANYSDIVLTVSEFSKKQIQTLFKIKDIDITPNAVDAIYFEEYDKEKIKAEVQKQYGLDKYWLYISRWEPRKNHHTLLKVFVENNFHKEYSLVFIGDKDMVNAEYDAYFETLPKEVQAKVITMNKVEFNILLQLLRGADLSVYPSMAEGFGIPPIEAVAARVPSVCSNTTAMADFDFLKEFMFDPLDKKDMANTIQKVLTNKVTMPNIEEVKTKYSWEVSAEILNKRIEDFRK